MFLYNCLLLLAYPLLWLAARFHRRLRMNFDLRSALPDFSAARGKTHIWFHASSAGEFEQVRALAMAMRKNYSNLFFSFTFFSDSTFRTRKNDSVPDLLFALPFDFPWRMKKLVAAMRPAVLIIGKYDAWPNQVRAAVAASVLVYLASATIPEKSLRYRFPLRIFLRDIYVPMQQIFAINEVHAGRLRVISPHNVTVLGDTRFDAIAARLSESFAKKKELAAITPALRGKLVILGGSTYEASEQMLMSYLAVQRKPGGKKMCLILAPHHLAARNISRIEDACAALNLRSLRLSKLAKQPWDVLIVDGFGLLAVLYPLVDVAYVGGGFEGSVHSVIEAAIAGTPVVTGPAISNSAEAMDLRDMKLLRTIQTPSAAEFGQHVENLWKNRKNIGHRMSLYFRQRLGVSNIIMHTVMDDLSQGIYGASVEKAGKAHKLRPGR